MAWRVRGACKAHARGTCTGQGGEGGGRASPRCCSSSVATPAASASTAGAASPSPKVEVGRGAKMWCANTPSNISECMPLTGSHTAIAPKVSPW